MRNWFKRKAREDRQVTVRYNGREYVLRENWTFVLNPQIKIHGDVEGTLTGKKNFVVEVISID